MNAEQFINSIKSTESYTNKHYSQYSFGSITFNGIDLWIVYNRRTNKPLMFNLTKLVKALKSGLKTGKNADYCYTNKERFESRPNDFTYISGEGTQQYKGWYATLKWLRSLCFNIASFNGADWFDGVNEWYGDMYKGHIYLVQPPEYQGTNVFKIGKTGQTDLEMKKRWRGYIKDAKDDGVNGLDILGLVAVKNTSTSEKDAKEYYKNDDRIHFIPGADDDDTEYMEVDAEPEDAANIVIDLFIDMCNEFEEEGKLQSCDNAFETFESGTNVFHYEVHKKQ